MLVGDRGRRGGGRAPASSLGVAATSIDRAARIVRLSTGEDARLRPARARHRLARERAHARRRGAAPPRPGLAREVRAAARRARRRPAARASRRCATSPTPSGCRDAVRGRPPHRRARRRRARPRARPRRRARRRRRSASCTTDRTRCRATSTAAAGRCCVAALRRTGVTVIAHSRAEAVAVPHRRRRAPPVRHARHRRRQAASRGDLLVLSCGVEPAQRARRRSPACARAVGIVVNPQLQSGATRDVYAIGDCAQVVDAHRRARGPAGACRARRPGSSARAGARRTGSPRAFTAEPSGRRRRMPRCPPSATRS